MTYKTTTKKLKRKLFLAQEMREHYEELFKTTLWELKFSRLQIDHYKSMLDEVEVLNNKWVKHSLINKVIQNWKERAVLDISIHFDDAVWIDNKAKV